MLPHASRGRTECFKMEERRIFGNRLKAISGNKMSRSLTFQNRFGVAFIFKIFQPTFLELPKRYGYIQGCSCYVHTKLQCLSYRQKGAPGNSYFKKYQV